MPDSDALAHIVIVGGGFGGLYAARRLRGARARITLVDRRNHHLFFPLLYQVATAGLSPGDIAAPIRRVLRDQANATVLMGEVRSIDVTSRKVRVADGHDGELAYDYLILAAGSASHYFGHDEWAVHAPALMSLEGALEVRRRLLVAYERAELEPDPARRKAWLTFVIVGGGPTGVEMAGAIVEMARHTLARDFRRIDPRTTRVLMIEGVDRVLPAFDAGLSTKARASLERLGVEVRTGARVTAVDDQGVSLGAERIEARTVVWAAGVSVSPLAQSLGAPLDRTGRVLVEPDLSVPGHPEVFVVGDLAAVRRGQGFVPALAQPAIQEGRHAARSVLDLLAGRRPSPFHYRDRGTMATIGRASAVADFGRVKLSGWIAWTAWLFIHIVWLIGFSNRVLVMFQWAWAYVTWDRAARLVTSPPRDGKGGITACVLIVAAAVSTSPSPDEARLVRLINQERTTAHLGQVAWDPALARLARLHAADMRSMEKVTHHSGADGADFAARLARTDYRASHAAENVALDIDVIRAHAALMKSPGHRANILNPSLTAIGVGIVRARDGAAYIVEDFATPLSRMSDREATDKVREAIARGHRAGKGPRKVAELEEEPAISRELGAAVRSMVEQDSVAPRKDWGFEAGWVFTYTAADPAALPPDAAARMPGARAFAVAVTYSRSRSYPFGIWWVVLALKS